MRIVIIAEVFLPKVDGVVIRTMNLIRHLLERGDEVLVICPHAEDRGNCPTPYVEFRSFPFPSYPEYRIGVPDGRLIAAINDFQPDVLHFLNPFAFGFRCFDMLRKAHINLPSVFSFHTLYGEFVKRYAVLKPLSKMLWWLMRDYHNCADANLTVSTVMQKELTARGFERVEFWPPAVDSTLFVPHRADPDMRRRLANGRPDRPLLISVSRLAPEKNVQLLAEVLRRTPEAQLAIIGDGPQRADLERRFAGTNAHFLGYMQGVELAAAYASSDAFVYASETETMGNVILEAMASGLPCVAPRAGGIPSLITDGENGLLYAPGDAFEAADCVSRLLSDNEYREKMALAARAAMEHSGWRESVERVRQHYEATIKEHARGGRVVVRRPRMAPVVMATLVMAFRTAAVRPRRRSRKKRPASHVT